MHTPTNSQIPASKTGSPQTSARQPLRPSSQVPLRRPGPFMIEPSNYKPELTNDPTISYPLIAYRPPATKVTPKAAAPSKPKRRSISTQNLSLHLWRASAITAFIMLLFVSGIALSLSSQLQRALQQLEAERGSLAAIQSTNGQQMGNDFQR